MFLPEEVARETYCPLLNVHCQVSRCMMWRWDTSTENEDLEAFRGYCGLAGKPGGGDNAGNKN